MNKKIRTILVASIIFLFAITLVSANAFEIKSSRPPKAILTKLDVRVLDTWVNDSFDVYVKNILVYSYIDQEPINDTPTWIMHSIDISSYKIIASGFITVKIVASGPICDILYDYGVVAVDTIALYKTGNVLCDSVDIGNETSEATHNISRITGWSPFVEPYLHPSEYWGGIFDCRVVWQEYTVYDDQPWATVDFYCDFMECRYIPCFATVNQD